MYLTYLGKTPTNFNVVLFIVGLPLVHTENGGLDAKGFPTPVLGHQHFERIRRSRPQKLIICPSNFTVKTSITNSLSGLRLPSRILQYLETQASSA